jgi:hypothetical protein
MMYVIKLASWYTMSHISLQMNFSSQFYNHVTFILIFCLYEEKSISKLQIMIEKKQMGIMIHKQHLFFNVISTQI